MIDHVVHGLTSWMWLADLTPHFQKLLQNLNKMDIQMYVSGTKKCTKKLQKETKYFKQILALSRQSSSGGRVT